MPNAREQFQLEEKPKRRRGIRFGPFPLFLLSVVSLAAISALIVMTVFFVEQGQEISDLKNALKANGTVLPPQRPSTVTPASTTILPSTVVTVSPSLSSTAVPTDSPTTITTVAPTASPALFRESYRLPLDIIPSHYDIFLKVFLPFTADEENEPNAFTTTGEVKINISCEKSTNVIVLHSWNLTILSEQIDITGLLGSKIDIVRTQHDEVRHFLIIHLARNLTEGGKYQIEIKYTGLIVSENQGLYRSKYTLPNGQIRWLASTQFQPYKARRVFPCFDEPSFRATFQITVQHDSRFTGTYSIRKKTSSAPVPDLPNWTESQFERTGEMPTYLLALLVSDFERNSTMTADDIDFGVLSRGNTLTDATFAMAVGINMTEHFGQLFNMSYKQYNSKLDMVAVPDFDSGAMENWGLITYREVYMLYRQGISSAEDKLQIARIVAHELAHQWFGNPVTCSWWSEAFLNEGFASFLEFPLVKQALPEWQLEKFFTISEHRVAFDADAYETSVPLYNPNANTPAEIENMFGRITYQKGASVLRMIEGFMGSSNFYAALKSYLAERSAAGGVTTHRHLLQAFTDQMALVSPDTGNITNLFEEWIATSGFPLVTVKRTNNTLTLTQERFLLGNASATNRTWNIPFTYIANYQAATNSTNSTESADLLSQQTGDLSPVWFLKTEATHLVELPNTPKWILANIQSFGFYRVNYDLDNWNALSAQLKSNHSAIHMFSRVQLIDDAFNLARKGLVDYSAPINLIQYLPLDTEYPPWASTISSLQYIDSMIGGGSNDSLRRFMQKIMGEKYKSDFWNTTEVWQDGVVENYQQLTLRAAVIESACYHGLDTCITEASRKFEEWKSTNSSDVLIDPHLKDKIFCYGIRNGTLEDYDYLLWQHDQAELHTTKLSILKGLGCSRDESLILRLLNLTLDINVVRSQDTSYVLRYASKFPAGQAVAWTFLKENWRRLPAKMRGSMITDIAGSFNTEERLSDVNEFFVSLGSNISEKIAFEGALARIRSNIQWMSSYSKPVLAALADSL